MPRTEEQDIIIDSLKYVENSIGVKAFAGTGKSFLLKEATLEYENKNFLGLAFNGSIVSENNSKFPKKNSIWYTVHGLARTFFENAKYDIGRIKKEYTIMEIIDILKIKNNDYILSSLILEVFDLYCNSALQSITVDSIFKAATTQRKQNILLTNKEVLEVACVKAQELWNLFLHKKIPTTHSFYLKLFELKRLAINIKKFDFLLVDEAQDTNPASMSIIEQIPAKKVYVGDPHQSIYAFRGVINAISLAEEQYYLSTTFRYQQHIADKASKFLLKYRNEKKHITSLASKLKTDSSNAILFRNNSSMIEIIDEFIQKDINYKTMKEPKTFFKTSLIILEFRLNNTYPKDKNFKYFGNFNNYEELKKYISESGDKELSTADMMQRRYGKRIYTFLIHAQNKFKESYTNHIILCTGHVSKGLEWGSVEIFHDFPKIDKKMKKSEIVNAIDLQFKADENNIEANELIQEINLQYVAITRAKHTLKNPLDMDMEE